MGLRHTDGYVLGPGINIPYKTSTVGEAGPLQEEVPRRDS